MHHLLLLLNTTFIHLILYNRSESESALLAEYVYTYKVFKLLSIYKQTVPRTLYRKIEIIVKLKKGTTNLNHSLNLIPMPLYDLH